MGLFDKLVLPLPGRAKPTLKPVPTPEDPQAVLAPVTGRLVALDEVADPAFAQGMLGRGVGIRAEGDVAYAPVSGVVAADVKTKHALLFRADNGAEVLLHVGLDSVTLRGAGFRTFVRKGERVSAGAPVMSFDRALMAERGLDDTVMLTVTNADDFSAVESVRAEGKVDAGSVVMRCAR